MPGTLLFIHGFLDDATVWDGVIAALAGKVDTVRYNLPGFGTRSHAVGDPRAVTLESLAAEAGDIVARIDGPVIVVGQSMGSQVAELVAATHADRVQGLVLLTPVPLGGTRLPAEVVAPFRALGGDADAQRALRTELSPNLTAHQVNRLVRIGDPVRPDVVARYVDMWNDGVNDAPENSAFTGPVLLVRGGADGFVTEQLVAAISPRFAHADVRVIEKGGHWVHIEYPEAVAAMVLEFTEAIAGVAA
jgi:esterase